MADDLSPADIRARKFAAVRRGYDRSEVTAFLERVADHMSSVEGELAAVKDRMGQLGITDLPNLKEELEDVGVEIQAVLDAAMEAAAGLRSRASADAADTVHEADEASRGLRSDAWMTGTTLLEQADDTARHLVAEAREDALFIRAEAEQDAKRLVSDARRQADEFIRSSREEGERIVVIAKAESEAILEGARQSAEKAQERARALENRRSELLSELEAAEATIRDIETMKSEQADAGIRVIAPGSDDRTHWPDDEGAVRILPSAPPEPTAPEPVDAEAIAAEVEQLRATLVTPEPAESAAAEVAESPAGMSGVEETLAAIDDVPPVEAAELEDLEDQVAESDSRAATTEPEDKVTIVHDPDIDALFAKLRQAPDVEAEAAKERETVQRDAVQPEDSRGEVSVAVAVEPEQQRPDLHLVPPPEIADDFDRRDRMLLPIENRGLRGLKRRIVELQNRVLEELRTSAGEWRLGRELVVQTMGDELDDVLADSFNAGHAAAAESMGQDQPQLTGGPQQGAAEVFTADLHRDVQAVIDREGGKGTRRLSSDVGRVFRSWRTEEAERHVRLAARRAFNDGLLAGYARLGVSAVEIVAHGRPCGACAAGSGITWAPDEGVPEGVVLPPVGPSCAAMVVPAGTNGFDSRSGQ